VEHGRDDVHYLKARLLAAQNALLARDHHHRHRTEQGISRTRGQVQCSGTQSREADAWLTGQASVRGRHESSRLLMPRYDQPDSGMAETLDHIEILFSGHTEDSVYALILKSGYEQFSTFHMFNLRFSRDLSNRYGLDLVPLTESGLTVLSFAAGVVMTALKMLPASSACDRAMNAACFPDKSVAKSWNCVVSRYVKPWP
jgi:hypothetical protein